MRGELLARKRGCAPADQLPGLGLAAPVPVRPGQRLEVAVDGVVAVHHRLAAAERAPEVEDVRAARAVQAEVERQQLRARRDQHRHRAGALGGLARGLHAVAGDVGADDDRRLAVRHAGGDPLRRGHERRGPAVAGVLHVEDPHVPRQPDQPLDERGDGLAVVDAGLGAHREHPDAKPGSTSLVSISRRAAVAARATVSSPGSATAISRTPRPAMYLAGSTPRARARSSR